MLCQGVKRGVAILELAERPFINDVGVASIIEQTRSDPWLFKEPGSAQLKHQGCSDTHLKDEPATQIDATD